MQYLRIILAVLVCLAGLTPALAQGADDGWAALLRPGTHALMRHATAPGTGDPANFVLGDCSTQRNLDDRGQAEAAATGAQIRDRGVTVTLVLTSQWCRTRETAALLGLGSVREEPSLNSFFGDRSTSEAQTAQAKALLAGLPADAKAMLVTHQVNITALTGIVPASGEIVVVSVSDSGEIVVEGRIPPR